MDIVGLIITLPLENEDNGYCRLNIILPLENEDNRNCRENVNARDTHSRPCLKVSWVFDLSTPHLTYINFERVVHHSRETMSYICSSGVFCVKILLP